MKVLSGGFTVKKQQGEVPFPLGLQREGAVLDVEIAVPSSLAKYLTGKKLAVPQPIRGWALVDSGATTSCVDNQVIKRLGVKPIRQTTVLGADGPSEQNVYPARFIFRQVKMSFEFASAIGANLEEQSIMGRKLVALIGRNVLSRCIFIYNGINATYTLAI